MRSLGDVGSTSKPPTLSSDDVLASEASLKWRKRPLLCSTALGQPRMKGNPSKAFPSWSEGEQPTLSPCSSGEATSDLARPLPVLSSRTWVHQRVCNTRLHDRKRVETDTPSSSSSTPPVQVLTLSTGRSTSTQSRWTATPDPWGEGARINPKLP